MLTSKDLNNNQINAYKDILRKKAMCVSSDCGFGKTIVGLSAYVLMKKRDPKAKMLVVCIPEGVKKTWSQEHLKWTHTKNLKVTPLLGNPKQRMKLLKDDSDVYVISYNLLKWLLDNNKGKDRINFSFVFADEGDCLKGSSSKWRSYLLRVAPDVKYKVISSATPKTRDRS